MNIVFDSRYLTDKFVGMGLDPSRFINRDGTLRFEFIVLAACYLFSSIVGFMRSLGVDIAYGNKQIAKC